MEVEQMPARADPTSWVRWGGSNYWLADGFHCLTAVEQIYYQVSSFTWVQRA